MGVDVGVRKGLDVVVLDGRREAVEARRVRLEELGKLIDAVHPDVVAIDSPPRWALRPGSRETERVLRRLGILCYATPTENRGRDHPFYEWMRVGFRAFEVAAARDFPPYRSGEPRGTAIEVFPHASAAVLSGVLPPRGTARRPSRKQAWRRAVLEAQRVDAPRFRTIDQVDAALAALTGILALEGTFVAEGDTDEGVIVLPVGSLPERLPREPATEVTT